MQKTVYIFTLCIATIFILPQLATAQDSRARVEEVLSYFPAGFYSVIYYYDFEAVKAASSFELFNEHEGWSRTEEQELSPLPKVLGADVSSLAKAVRVRFRISGFKEDPDRGSVPEILLDENGKYKNDPSVTDQTFLMFSKEERVAIINYGRTFRVYRIIALDDKIKQAVKNGGLVMEEGSILGVPYYRIEENPAKVPYLCCSVEPDVLLMAEDKSMLEDLVAVSVGNEASLASEEFYDEVILLGSELGPKWDILNVMKSTHPSIIRKLRKFGISEESLEKQRASSLDAEHFYVNTYILESDYIEREIMICGSEEGAKKVEEFRKSHDRYGISDDALEAAKVYNRAYNAAWKVSREGTIVTSQVVFDKDLLALKTESEKAWKQMREEYLREKEADEAKKKAAAEKK